MNDTHPDIQAMQIALLRQATFQKRFAIVESLTSTTRALSRRAIERANPTWTKEQVDLAFVAYHYGEDLAERVRVYLGL